MSKAFVLILMVLMTISCKKAIEEIQKDLVVEAMTSGQWVVTNYVKGTSNITSDFSGYAFVFKENKTVDAIKTGSVQHTGTWDGNANAQTITSSFNNANVPLTLLNGTWSITRNNWTFVEATQTVNGEVRTLRLDKQ
ncbi:MAG: hypothetical protein ABR502_04345 [Chitinophagaceae bacterium]